MIYGQRDPRWAGQRLGVCNGVTIGGEGCYVSCMAMTATHFGHDVNPAQLDDLFTGPPILYLDGCDGYPGILSKVYQDIKFVGVGNWQNSAADLNWLKQGNDFYTDVIIEVDFDHNPNDGIQTHFVRMVSYGGGTDGNDLVIDDPWYAEEAPFSKRYGNNPQQTILQAVAYHKDPPPPAPVPTPQVNPVSAAQPSPPPPAPAPTPTPAPVVDKPVDNPIPPVDNAPAPQPIPITITPVPDPTPAPSNIGLPAPKPVIADRMVESFIALLRFIFTLGGRL